MYISQKFYHAPRIFLLIFSLTLLLYPTTGHSASVQLTGTVSNQLVNVRNGPGTNYSLLGQVRQGEQIDVVARNTAGDWLRICCPFGNNVESWVRSDLVTLQAAGQGVNALPVANAPAAGNASGGAAAQAAAPVAPRYFAAPTSVNPLTGMALPAGRASQRPIIACVNNEVASRPQFGLSQADVVYEYLVEGYVVTRYSAIYYGEEPTQIGPMRSTRIVNYDLASLYTGVTVCSGASDAVRNMMQAQSPYPYMDIDIVDFYNTTYSFSIGRDYRTRLRTSTAMIRRWLNDVKLEGGPSVRGFTFGTLSSPGASANTINIPYPRSGQVDYRYDPSSGRYLRSLGGTAHIDANSGGQLAIENVLVQYTPHEETNIIEDSLGSRSVRIRLIGSGRALLFRDGQAIEGTWQSNSNGDTPHFYNQAGSEVPFKVGKTWVNVVPTNYTITYR